MTGTRKRVHVVRLDEPMSHSVLYVRSRRQKQSHHRKTIPCLVCTNNVGIISLGTIVLFIVFSILLLWYMDVSNPKLWRLSIQSLLRPKDTLHTSLFLSFPIRIRNHDQVQINHSSIIYNHYNTVDYHFESYFPSLSSCQDLDMNQIDYTLVTQLSEDRLWMMKHICTRWGITNPISIVLYTNRSHLEILQDLRKMGCISFHNDDRNTLDKKKTSQLQIVDSSDSLPEEYPINQLRNMAIAAVQTSHALYIDIDLWPSNTLYTSLHHPTVRQALSLEPKLTIVIPSFQLNSMCRIPNTSSCIEKNVNKMPFTALEIPTMVKAKHVTQLDPSNMYGHGSTNYREWFRVVNSIKRDKGQNQQQHQQDHKKYSALYNITCFTSNRYEPYLVFRVCDTLPPFQEQFTGYGKNKITWIIHLRRRGYRFTQLNEGGDFLIHLPHVESPSRVKWNHGPLLLRKQSEKKNDKKQKQMDPRDMKNVDWLQYKRGKVDLLYVAFKEWLETTTPDQSRVSLCKNTLEKEEKLWIHRSNKKSIG